MGKASIKPIFFAILALILVCMSCLATGKELYEAWHYSGDTFTVEGDVYKVTHYNFEDTSVVLTVNKNSHIINEGECQVALTKEFCILEIFRNIGNATEKDPIKFENGEVLAGISVQINSRGPDIKVTREFSTLAPELNDEISVSVTIENTGSEGTDTFLYEEELPKGVVITSSSASVSDRKLSYHTNVPSNEKKTFTYSFTVTDYMEFTSAATINYTFADKKFGQKSDSKTIKVSRPYGLTPTLSPTSIEVSDQAALSIKVENLVSGEINITELRITIPSLLAAQPKPGELVQTNNQYLWQSVLLADEYKLINILLNPAKAGKYIIPVSIKVKDNAGKEFSETKNVTLTSTLTAIETILSVHDSSVSSEGGFRVAFSVKNPNAKIGFKNITVILSSAAFGQALFEAELGDLAPGKTQTLIVNDSLIAPLVSQKTTFIVLANGTYKTSWGEQFDYTKKESLIVTPVSQAITILQEADRNAVAAGENLTVTVKIKNNNQESIIVAVRDEYDPRAELIGGKTSETLQFTAAETKQAYTYKLRIPKTYNTTDFVVNTFASIAEKDFETNKSLAFKINVSLEQPKQENITEQKPPEAAPVAPVQKEKPGAFKKIMNAIGDFFKRLVGKK